jgi:transcriptional regulator with XRE-family HTH domain
MTDPHSFGAWLRRERERRSITLRAIADRTKIGAGRLEALERGNISHWPGGIYRRAFVRAYADVVGLDADLVVANFERVYPSDPSAVVPLAPVSAANVEQPEMRLALVMPAVAGVTASAMKTAGRDVACIFAFALVGLAIGGTSGFWCCAAVAALGFHVSRVLGLHESTIWRHRAEHRQPAAGVTRAEVVSFTDEQTCSTSRRMLADLSAASSASFSGLRRAARS